MAEAYHNAILKRLGMIDQMGADATSSMQSMMSNRGITRPVVNPGAGAMRRPMEGDPLIQFGTWLQNQGGRISEHPHWNNGRRITSGHSRNSKHYTGDAFDLNFGPGGTSRTEQKWIDKMIREAARYGLKSIWRAPGHFNHAHIYR